MKIKNLIKSVGFLLGLFLILLGLSVLLRRKGDGEVYDAYAVDRKVAQIEAETNDTLDIFFMGDSICYSSFEPHYIWNEYGYTSFVCGTSAQRVCDTYAILSRALETQTPKTVVLEATCFYRNMSKKSDSKDLVLDELTERFDAFAYHSEWKNIAGRIGMKFSKRGPNKEKGFVGRKAVNPYRGGEYMIATDEVDEIKPEVIEYLNKIDALCDEKGIELIVVSVPSPRNWTYERHNAVSNWAMSADVTYLDMNIMPELDIDWEVDTKDGGDHLNLAGARKVSGYIGNYIGGKVPLEDKRNDEKYSDWTYYGAEDK